MENNPINFQSAQVGGATVNIDDPRNIFLYVVNTGGGYSSLREGNTPYVVPTGFKLVMIACEIKGVTSTSSQITLGTATASSSGGSAPTGWTAFGSYSYDGDLDRVIPMNIVNKYEWAAGSYPTMLNATAQARCNMVARLEAV